MGFQNASAGNLPADHVDVAAGEYGAGVLLNDPNEPAQAMGEFTPEEVDRLHDLVAENPDLARHFADLEATRARLTREGQAGKVRELEEARDKLWRAMLTQDAAPAVEPSAPAAAPAAAPETLDENPAPAAIEPENPAPVRPVLPPVLNVLREAANQPPPTEERPTPPRRSPLLARLLRPLNAAFIGEVSNAGRPLPSQPDRSTPWHDVYPDLSHINTRNPARTVLHFKDRTQLVDEGQRGHVTTDKPDLAAARLVAFAAQKGWNPVKFSGDGYLIREAFEQALKKGLAVTPADDDQRALLDQLRGITRTSRAEPKALASVEPAEPADDAGKAPAPASENRPTPGAEKKPSRPAFPRGGRH